MDERKDLPDERPQRRREYSGPWSTLGAAAVVILAVGVAIWYFEFAGGSTRVTQDAELGIVALPEGANSTGEAPVAEEGRAAPNFLLETIDGERRRLTDFRGEWVVVNFWASWCGPCATETPVLRDFHEEHADRGIVVVGVNQQEPLEQARNFAERYAVSYPMLLDWTGEVSDGYRVSTSLPVTVVVDPEGVVFLVHRGPVVAGDLEAMLEGHVF